MLYFPAGSEIDEALQIDFKHSPGGIFFQSSIVFPNTRVCTPCALRWDATERPYGPAPMTTVVSYFTSKISYITITRWSIKVYWGPDALPFTSKVITVI